VRRLSRQTHAGATPRADPAWPLSSRGRRATAPDWITNEEGQLPALRDEALATLGRAAPLDPGWKPLVEERADDLGAVRLAESSDAESAAKSRGETGRRPRETLASGNLEELAEIWTHFDGYLATRERKLRWRSREATCATEGSSTGRGGA